jgi:hypothetical protein
MEEIKQTENTKVERDKKLYKTLFFPMLLILINIIILIVIFVWTKNKINETENHMLSVNYHSSTATSGEANEYKTFQLEFLSKYSVITGNMWIPYDTQGGIAQPELIFTVGEQPLREDSHVGYIFVYAIEDVNSIEEWDSLPFGEEDYEVVEETTKEMEYFNIYERTISTESQEENVFEAYVFLPENVSYYFRTIGDISKEDFYSIVESLKVRGFINWE